VVVVVVVVCAVAAPDSISAALATPASNPAFPFMEIISVCAGSRQQSRMQRHGP
jgi:hypothetical protein